MSKVSFRARALDSTKPLTLYYSEELPDLAEYVAINRQVPQMPTGMEKEEESECHLQQVMIARQTLQDTAKVVIPTPEASIPANHYTEVYQPLPHYPQQYVRMPGLALDEEAVDYDLDSEDDEWLSVQSQERPLSPLHFERMMDRLEKGSGNTVLSVRDAQLLLKDEDDLVIAVYDYWLAKRLRLGRSLVPIVKHERRDGSSSSNPYLAFRKRTEKMQTRKNRKNDEMAYMHMLKLKRDLARAITLMERVKEREKNKKDLALVYNEIFRKRYQLEDWSGSLISTLRPVATPSQTSSDRHPLTTGSMTWDGKGLFKQVDSYDDGIHSIGRHDILLSGTKKKSKKKAHKYSLSPLVDVETPLLSTVDKGLKETPGEPVEKADVEEPDGAFTFKRKVHVHYYTPNRSLGEWPWDSASSSNEPASKKFHFSATSLGSNICCFSRRRVGRGGRAVWDCLAPLDSEGDESEKLLEEDLQKIDVESLASESAGPDGDMDTAPSSRHLFFHPGSPDDNFELTCLPLVEPSTYPCPDPCSGFTDFGGTSLDPDCVNEVSSFSALPTSQFALWPSTSDMDADSDGEESYDLAPARPSLMGLEPSTSAAAAASVLESKAPIASTSVCTEFTEKQTQALQSSQLPSTQLTAIQGGLPVQIHVENIRHLPVPRKEASSVNPKDKGMSVSHAPTAGLREGTELQPIPWHFESPGSGLLTLNAPTQRARRCSRLRHLTVSGSIAAQITSEFVTEKRTMKEEKELSNDIGSVVAKVGVVAPAPPISSGRSDLQQPLSQQHSGHVAATPPLSTAAVGMSDLVSLSQQHHFTNNTVMTDGKMEVLVKDKRGLGPVPAPNHQKGSPNGCVPELLHSRKMPSDGDKELKAAGTVTHNNSVVDSGSNSLVQLTPSSEIT